MKLFRFLTFLTLISLTAISCSKDDTAPVISITSPSDGTILSPGGEFTVKGTVTDDEELAEIEIGGNKITTFTSKASHTIDSKFTVSATQALGVVNFDVSATDKEGNKSTKTIKLTIK
jgi:hypothetical protein